MTASEECANKVSELARGATQWVEAPTAAALWQGVTFPVAAGGGQRA